MGNWRDWLTVALLSFLWAGWMSMAESRRRKAAGLKPVQFSKSILEWLLPALPFGYLLTFKWRAFHIPLVYVTVAIFASYFGIVTMIGKAPFAVFAQPVRWPRMTWMKVTSFFLFMIGLASLLVTRAVTQEIGLAFVVAGAVALLFDYFHSRRSKPG